MDYLSAIIESLDPRERAEFRRQLTGTGQRHTRADVKLLEALENQSGSKRHRHPLPGRNSNAYHSLRKRLTAKATSYIIQLGARHTTAQFTTPADWLYLSEFFLERGKPIAARQALLKAEGLAGKKEQWDLLNRIYYLQLGHAEMLEWDVPALVEKIHTNKARTARLEQLAIVQGLIRYRLAEARRSGHLLDLNQIISEAYRFVDMQSADMQNAGFMFQIATMVRSGIISTRNYVLFEPFVIGLYIRLLRARAFDKATPSIRWQFMYMLAHALYRNRKFVRADKMIKQLLRALPPQSAAYNPLRTKVLLLQAVCLNYQGHNEAAINILERTLENSGKVTDVRTAMDMHLNLCVYYFQSGQFGKAARVLQNLGHTDRWLEKKMGREWRFKKNLIEAIVLFELGHVDLVSSRLKSLESQFAGFLRQPFYRRAGVFIGFIKTLISQPEEVRTRAFEQKVEQANLALPGDREDTQAVAFFCWLKSKMYGSSFQTELMSTLKAMQ